MPHRDAIESTSAYGLGSLGAVLGIHSAQDAMLYISMIVLILRAGFDSYRAYCFWQDRKKLKKEELHDRSKSN